MFAHHTHVGTCPSHGVRRTMNQHRSTKTVSQLRKTISCVQMLLAKLAAACVLSIWATMADAATLRLEFIPDNGNNINVINGMDVGNFFLEFQTSESRAIEYDGNWDQGGPLVEYSNQYIDEVEGVVSYSNSGNFYLVPLETAGIAGSIQIEINEFGDLSGMDTYANEDDLGVRYSLTERILFDLNEPNVRTGFDILESSSGRWDITFADEPTLTPVPLSGSFSFLALSLAALFIGRRFTTGKRC